MYIRAENWWHISTQKPPNVGSSIAIPEPIIAGLVSARGLPNPVKLGNQLDWVGARLCLAQLGMLNYVMAVEYKLLLRVRARYYKVL